MFHRRLHPDRDQDFKVSRLRYAVKTYKQYQVAVKLPGSFRLAAGNRHLHRYCIFTERVSETVAQTLHYSTRRNLPDTICYLCSATEAEVTEHTINNVLGGLARAKLCMSPCSSGHIMPLPKRPWRMVVEDFRKRRIFPADCPLAAIALAAAAAPTDCYLSVLLDTPDVPAYSQVFHPQRRMVPIFKELRYLLLICMSPCRTNSIFSDLHRS